MVRTGDKLMVRLWEGVEQSNRDVARLCAADGPAAALVRVYGPSGPRVALGVGDRVRLLDVTSSSSVLVPETDYWLTVGHLGASDRAVHPFQVLWHAEGGGPRIDEIVGVANGIWPWLPWRPNRVGPERGLWSAPTGPNEAAATRRDPVAALILATTKECQGVALAARCLASWWRLDPSTASSLSGQSSPEVVAAALDKLVSRRASTARRGDLEVSEDYDTDPAAVKSMAARLQRRLGLSAIQPW